MILYQASRPRHRSSARSRTRAPETAAGTATRFLARRTPCLDNETCVALPPSATRAVDLQKRALGGEWTRPDPGEGGDAPPGRSGRCCTTSDDDERAEPVQLPVRADAGSTWLAASAVRRSRGGRAQPNYRLVEKLSARR